MHASAWEIGLCSWSVDRTSCLPAMAVAKRLGLPCLQLGFFGDESLHRADAREIGAALRDSSRRAVGLFVGFDGEDRNTAASLSETGGLAGDMGACRTDQLQRAVALAKDLSVDSVAFHVGTVPTLLSEPRRKVLHHRLMTVASTAHAAGVRLHLETGRERADALATLIDEVNTRWESHVVGINFDGANFIIFETDDPLRAAVRLRDRIALVHLKDATRPSGGEEFGRRASLGVGEANVPRVLSKLRSFGYSGPLLLESSGAPESIKADLDYIRSMVA